MKNVIFIIPVLYLSALACKDRQHKEKLIDSDIILEASPAPTEPISLSQIKINPIEHASAVLEWGDHTIYIDPVGSTTFFEAQKQPDLILITDIHGDHFSLETLKEIHTKRTKIIAPKAVADQMSKEFFPQIMTIANGDIQEVDGILIEAVPMYNLRNEAIKFHEKGRGNGYVLTLGTERVYFSGDTEDIPEMRGLKNIDKAFVCMNLPIR